MSTPPEQPTEKISKAPVVAALLVLLLVLAVAFGSRFVRDEELVPDTDDSPAASASPTTDGAGEAAVDLRLPSQDGARCLPVDEESLARAADLAFDGEVLSVEDDTVTLAVREWYVGGNDAAQVRLGLVGVPTSLAGQFDFEQGRRYLVSASDGTVLICGYSGPYADQLAGTYEDAFQR